MKEFPFGQTCSHRIDSGREFVHTTAMRSWWKVLALVSIGVWFAPRVHAQAFEAGFQISGLRLREIGESPVGVGARLLLNLNDSLAVDLEGGYFPENPSGNFGQSTALAGIKAGARYENFGLFAKARTGVIHFGGAFYDLRMDDRTHFLLDLGGVIEYYPSARTVLRVDAGDAVIPFGETRLQTTLDPGPLGTTHNFQAAFGFSFRF